MKKFNFILAVLFVLVSTSLSAQIGFKPGYFIDNSGETTQCLIKDIEWKSNPTSFEYKTSEESAVQIAKIDNIQEFRIENFPKYIRKTVEMDRWDVFSPVTEERNSIYKTETLLLKELVKGPASLYGYADGALTTYFYEVSQNPIRQLVRKNYFIIDGNGYKITLANNMFKRQLYGDLKCDDITENQAKNLSYFEGDFVRFFQKYNTCMGAIPEESEASKTKLHLSARLGVVQNSFKMEYPSDARYNYDFGSKTSLRVGVEAEIVLPFNRNKWSLLLEPVYAAFKSEGDQTIFTDNVDYKAIEFQMGLRHYMFLSPDSRIFINLGVVYAININNGVYNPKRYSSILEYKPSPQIILGAGYKYNKLSAEVRYLGTQNFQADQIAWESRFTSLAFVLGYEIF